MSNFVPNLKRSFRALRHGKWKWGYMERPVKLELMKQAISLHIESRRSLLNIAVAAIGLNMAMLTLPNAHHSRLLHITSGGAVMAFFIAAVSISNLLLHQSAHINASADEEVINGLKPSPALVPLAKADKNTRRPFNTGVFLSFISVVQLFCATFPSNWF